MIDALAAPVYWKWWCCHGLPEAKLCQVWYGEVPDCGGMEFCRLRTVYQSNSRALV